MTVGFAMGYRENFAAIDFSKEIPAPRRILRESPKRSDLPFPMVVSDTMDPVQSQVDGKVYDSKSAIRASYRAHDVTEVGNDAARFRTKVKPKVERSKIKATVERAKARVERGERILYPGK
jgi:hypothetical protein